MESRSGPKTLEIACRYCAGHLSTLSERLEKKVNGALARGATTFTDTKCHYNETFRPIIKYA